MCIGSEQSFWPFVSKVQRQYLEIYTELFKPHNWRFVPRVLSSYLRNLDYSVLPEVNIFPDDEMNKVIFFFFLQAFRELK